MNFTKNSKIFIILTIILAFGLLCFLKLHPKFRKTRTIIIERPYEIIKYVDKPYEITKYVDKPIKEYIYETKEINNPKLLNEIEELKICCNSLRNNLDALCSKCADLEFENSKLLKEATKLKKYGDFAKKIYDDLRLQHSDTNKELSKYKRNFGKLPVDFDPAKHPTTDENGNPYENEFI